MITILRNNKNLMRVKSKVKSAFYKNNDKKKIQYNLPKATPELLEQIRLKMKVEQRENTIRFLVCVIVVLSILIYVLL